MDGTRARETTARVFGVVMLVAGVAHFLAPRFYLRFFAGGPDWVPGLFLVHASGVAEAVAGAATLARITRAMGTVAIFAMMLAFLPVHVVDLFRDNPVVGSVAAAWVRLPMQFVLIALAWWISPLWARRRPLR